MVERILMSLFDTLKNQATHIIKAEATRKKNEIRQELEKKIYTALNTKKIKITLESMPTTLEQVMDLELSNLEDPCDVAVLTLIALNTYRVNKEEGKKMLDFLNGPEPVSVFDCQFIDDRFMDGKDYVIDSYIDKTTPENGYSYSLPCTVTIIEQSDSYAQENYAKLFIVSSGADAPRPITLRYKPSTKQWFLWDFKLLLAEVVKPSKLDDWA